MYATCSCPDATNGSRCHMPASVYLLDSDAEARQSMARMVESHGMNAIPFESAQAYLAHTRTESRACLILDAKLPGALDLQRLLSGEDGPPIIFVSERSDIQYAVKVIKAGAVEFLSKPLNYQAFVAAVDLAIEEHVRLRERDARVTMVLRRYQLLSPREREVLPLIISGLRNKQAAWHLGVTEVTLQVHRGKIMRKMEAASFADLVRMAGLLNIPLFVDSPPAAKRPVIDVRDRRTATFLASTFGSVQQVLAG